MMNEQFFSPCPRGLEQSLAEEIKEIGGTEVAPADAGVIFRGDFDLYYRVNLMSRIANRVL